MGNDLSGLHHAGLVVEDMTTAISTYRRLGFTVPPPTYPTMPTAAQAPARPVGAANTHISLRRNFVELVTVVQDGQPVPDEAHLMPLKVPADRLPGLLAAVRGAVANLTVRLNRFQGMHILIFDSADLDRVATRLAAAGVGHGGVHAIQRPIETADGIRMVPARYLEINSDEPDAPRGLLPEGRVGVAENTTVAGQRRLEHANGAIDLVGCMMCVPDDALSDFEHRYESYLGCAADRNGPVRTFGLDGDATVSLVAASALPDVLPGEHPPVIPAFVAYTISVHDIARTERHLRAATVPYAKGRKGELVVPAGEALGAAVIFRTSAG